MIVRIMADGQYRIDESHRAELDEIGRLETELTHALDSRNEAHFHAVLTHLIAHIQSAGVPVPPDEIVASDMIVPAADMTLAETQRALASTQAH